MKYILQTVLILFSITLFTGCQTTDLVEDANVTVNTNTNTNQEDNGETTVSSTTSLVTLSLTDAPVDDENIDGVYVTFTGIKYEYENKDEGWQELGLDAPITLNLLDLRDGKVTSLGTKELKEGKVEHIRFVLDVENCYITFKDDPERKEHLEIPSGAQTGFKSTNGFYVGADGETNITADFDVRKSLTLTGKGTYKMKPTIRLVNNLVAGMVAGKVTLNSEYSSAIVYAYKRGTFEDSQATAKKDFGDAYASARVIKEGVDLSGNTEGHYRLYWIVEGEYDLIVAGYNNLGEFENVIGYIKDVPVEGAFSTTNREISEETLVDSL